MAEQGLIDAAKAYFDTMEINKISSADVPKNARCYSFKVSNICG
jgi:hypothetical protein